MKMTAEAWMWVARTRDRPSSPEDGGEEEELAAVRNKHGAHKHTATRWILGRVW